MDVQEKLSCQNERLSLKIEGVFEITKKPGIYRLAFSFTLQRPYVGGPWKLLILRPGQQILEINLGDLDQETFGQLPADQQFLISEIMGPFQNMLLAETEQVPWPITFGKFEFEKSFNWDDNPHLHEALEILFEGK